MVVGGRGREMVPWKLHRNRSTNRHRMRNAVGFFSLKDKTCYSHEFIPNMLVTNSRMKEHGLMLHKMEQKESLQLLYQAWMRKEEEVLILLSAIQFMILLLNAAIMPCCCITLTHCMQAQLSSSRQSRCRSKSKKPHFNFHLSLETEWLLEETGDKIFHNWRL